MKATREITDPSDYEVSAEEFKELIASNDLVFKADMLAEFITRKDIDKVAQLLDAGASLEQEIERLETTVTPLLVAVAVNDSRVNQLLKGRLSAQHYEYYELMIKTHSATVGAAKPRSSAGSRDAFTPNMHKDRQIAQGGEAPASKSAPAKKPSSGESKEKRGCVIF